MKILMLTLAIFHQLYPIEPLLARARIRVIGYLALFACIWDFTCCINSGIFAWLSA